MHAHLCLTPVRRLCARVIYSVYAVPGAGEARVAHVTFAVGEAVWCFVASKLRWPRCAIVPDLHLHHQRTPSSAI